MRKEVLRILIANMIATGNQVQINPDTQSLVENINGSLKKITAQKDFFSGQEFFIRYYFCSGVHDIKNFTDCKIAFNAIWGINLPI